MQTGTKKSFPYFYMAGINYIKTNTATRSLFSFDKTNYQNLNQKMAVIGVSECYILSTCNRTEIYGFCENPSQLIRLLCEETKGDADTFTKQAYSYQGEEAVKHLFQIVCGLDSQILGDFEITAQVKKALKLSKKGGLLGTVTEKLVNDALQTSKQVKNNTNLSSGIASVSFAAIQYLKQIPHIKDKHILLYGTGKMGKSTCKNLVSYLGCKNITLINRTNEKAKNIAFDQGLKSVPEECLKNQLTKTDIVLVATDAPKPTLCKDDLSERNKIIIDFSIPFNVEPAIRKIPEITTIDIDQLSQVQDKTLEDRKKEIPKALAIIDKHLKDSFRWNRNRKNTLILKGMKEKLEDIHQRELNYFHKETKTDIRTEDLELLSSRMIQKTLNIFAVKLKKSKEEADQYSRMLGDIFDTSTLNYHEKNN